MNVSPELLQAGVEQIFADWGCSMRLEDLHRQYSPATGEVREQAYGRSLVVIPLKPAAQMVSQTAAQLQVERQSFVVRRDDFPDPSITTSWRLVDEARTFDVLKISQGVTAELLILDCVLRPE
jgi:hypothetical protein